MLGGPDPKSLIDPVSADQLRSEVLCAIPEWADWGRPLAMSRRAQSLLMLSFCRGQQGR